MALKFVVDKLEDVDEPLRSHYVAENGKYYLATQGEHPKVTEFREKNVAPLKDVARFEGIDPAAVAADRARLAELEKARPDARIAELETQLATEKTARETLQRQTDRGRVRDNLRPMALAAGALPAAVEMLLDKAEPLFGMDSDVVKARPNTFSPTRPGEPLTTDEWLNQAVRDFAFLFHPSVGSGAHNSNTGGSGMRSADGRRVIQNPTAQQLGEHAAAVARGEVRFEYTNS